jgi:hypothetical protein
MAGAQRVAPLEAVRPAGAPLTVSALARARAWRQRPAHLAVVSPP